MYQQVMKTNYETLDSLGEMGLLRNHFLGTDLIVIGFPPFISYWLDECDTIPGYVHNVSLTS